MISYTISCITIDFTPSVQKNKCTSSVLARRSNVSVLVKRSMLMKNYIYILRFNHCTSRKEKVEKTTRVRLFRT
jgi:uncharacterized membrane protein